MIESFIDSWPLFAETYLAGWLCAALLAMLGVLVVARDQIFIGAGVSSVSTFGIALALTVGGTAGAAHFGHLHDDHGFLQSDAFAMTMAIVFAVGAALLTARPTRTGGESAEAVTGWVFLLGSAMSILVVARSPHGMEEVQRLMASTLIGADRADVLIFLALSATTAVVWMFKHRTLMWLVMDAPTARALGVSVGWWSFVTAAWLGLSLGVALYATGMLYTFGCLVLPALVAKHVCREVRPMFVVAPLVGVAAAVVGFVLANHFDFPPAQLTIALMAALLPAAWMVRRIRG